jgi:hypothetical protein
MIFLPYGVPPFHPAHMQGRGSELDLIPPQVRKLSGTQAVAVGYQDHGRVSVAVTIVLGGFCQLINLSVRQIFARSEFSIGRTLGALEH